MSASLMKKMTGIPFEDKMKDLTAHQIEKEKVLDWQLKEQLADIGFKL